MYAFFAVALTVAILWASRNLLLPVALAVLLAFTLAPLVRALERLKFGRVLSVLLVTAAVTTLVMLLGLFVLSEARDVASQVQQHQGNMQSKLVSLLKQLNLPGLEEGRSIEELAPLGQMRDLALSLLGTIAGALMPLLGTVAVVSILAVFILIYREHFRDRIIRLCGIRHITVTTDALDEAGSKVSRYLLMLVTTNAIHGFAVATALFLLGVPSAALWGVFAACFRFVPYVGPVASDVMPMALVIATSPGWLLPLETFAVLMVIELISNNVVETLLSSRGTGVSPPAVLVAAVFWGWIWGAAGLLLSTPLTVCLLVLGRHVPQLEFFSVMLADEPVLDIDIRIYQRLLASDIDEAYSLVTERSRGRSLARVLNDDVLGAIHFAEEEFARNAIDDEKIGQVLNGLESLINRLEKDMRDGQPSASPPHMRALCIPGEGRIDWLVASMLRVLAIRHGIDVVVLPTKYARTDIERVLETGGVSMLIVAAARSLTIRRSREIESLIGQVSGRMLVAVGCFGATTEVASYSLGSAEQVIDIKWRSLPDAERSLLRLRAVWSAKSPYTESRLYEAKSG